MVMGRGYRELADWALSDIDGWQYVDPLLGIVVLTAAVAVSLMLILTEVWAIFEESFTNMCLTRWENQKIRDRERPNQ